jgi:hypothetical protein
MDHVELVGLLLRFDEQGLLSGALQKALHTA